MNGGSKSRTIIRTAAAVTLSLLVTLLPGCSKSPSWKGRNDQAAKANGVELVTRKDIRDTGVVPSLPPGGMIKKADLPSVELAPGVNAKMYWGKGTLISWTTLAPGAEIPRETLPAERIMLVWSGSVEQLAGDNMALMRYYEEKTPWSFTPHRDFIYLKKGAENAVKAGPEGAEIVEIYWPVRADYVRKAGGTAPDAPDDTDYGVAPSLPEGQVLNYYDVQFSDLSSGTANSRLMNGAGVQCSFLSCDPGRESPFHAHPEEQLSIILRGHVNETIMDSTYTLEPGDIMYLPGNMVHRGTYDEVGCDMLDVFWPPRPGFIAKMNDRLEKFHALIPRDAKVELVHDGTAQEPLLNFTEGPVWLDGRLYLSNMWFAPDFSAGSPAKSNLLVMEPDGSLRVLVRNMQTNGLLTLGNGNLAVCDMFGHRVVEMTPSGRVVRTIADSFDGKPLDGPNDLVIDPKGGMYVTDPQFTPGLPKTQPGKAVYYVKPSGEVIRVINPGEMGQPNGILLSPDGKTLYVNNTRNMPVGNHIMAFDVNGDGSLANPREFAKLIIPPWILDKADVVTGADGMRMDTEGNLYVATHMGLQIFSGAGEFIGIVHVPVRPTSLAFGGEDMKTIYFASPNKLYKIRTNATGLVYPVK